MAVSYLGELVGARGCIRARTRPPASSGPGWPTRRFRRRKGTVRCWRNWPGRTPAGPPAVEFFERLWSPSRSTICARTGRPRDRKPGSWNWSAGRSTRSRTVDVGQMGAGRGEGRPNIPTSAMFVWPCGRTGWTGPPRPGGRPARRLVDRPTGVDGCCRAAVTEADIDHRPTRPTCQVRCAAVRSHELARAGRPRRPPRVLRRNSGARPVRLVWVRRRPGMSWTVDLGTCGL